MNDYLSTLIDGCSPTNQGPMACTLTSPQRALEPVSGGTAIDPHGAGQTGGGQQASSRRQFLPPDAVRAPDTDMYDNTGGYDERGREDRWNTDPERNTDPATREVTRDERPIRRRRLPGRKEIPSSGGRGGTPPSVRREGILPRRGGDGCSPGCANGGSCVNSKCVCPRGFSGTLCQTG